MYGEHLLDRYCSRLKSFAVPGSNEKHLRKALGSSADSLCFDLEDSVATDRKRAARETVLLTLNAGPSTWLLRIFH